MGGAAAGSWSAALLARADAWVEVAQAKAVQVDQEAKVRGRVGPVECRLHLRHKMLLDRPGRLAAAAARARIKELPAALVAAD